MSTTEFIPEGAMWRGMHAGRHFYKWQDGKAFVFDGPSTGWAGTGYFWRREEFDNLTAFEPVAPLPPPLVTTIATKRKELEAAGIDFAAGICASDRPGIAATPHAAEPTPAPTFYAKKHDTGGLLTVWAPRSHL